MKKKFRRYLVMMTAVLALSLFGGTIGQVDSQETIASKRIKPKYESAANILDETKRNEIEDKAYRDKMLSNSQESIELLKEIRDLLQQLNAKKGK